MVPHGHLAAPVQRDAAQYLQVGRGRDRVELDFPAVGDDTRVSNAESLKVVYAQHIAPIDGEVVDGSVHIQTDRGIGHFPIVNKDVVGVRAIVGCTAWVPIVVSAPDAIPSCSAGTNPDGVDGCCSRGTTKAQDKDEG